MKTAYILALCAAMAAVSTSCDHNELCEDHSQTGSVNVVFDWTNAPDANPEKMSLYLYPKNGGDARLYVFTNKNGGIIEVPTGEYTAVCINSDTEELVLNQPDNTTYSGSDMYKYLKLTTNLTTYDAEDERVANTPDAFWTDTNADVVVKSLSVDDVQTITLTPSVGYCTYTLQLKNIANVAHVREMSATLSGMAGGMYVAQRIASDDVVTFPFAVAFDSNNATGQGTFYTFGHCPTGTSQKHTVMIYAVMTSGSVYYQSVDVTDQVHNAPNQNNVVITIDGVTFSGDEGLSGGINVEKWGIWYEDVKM